jgi:hypothetical protein
VRRVRVPEEPAREQQAEAEAEAFAEPELAVLDGESPALPVQSLPPRLEPAVGAEVLRQRVRVPEAEVPAPEQV